ncbi:hypothetical protein IP91_00139 [Pseudoduganella lurida]|uniref:Hpt domain-containing protein n=1 Tax=Pseudoduganella lurida TaxID=1036180 RepID=A0A562RKE7_9BURK|nr:Hpt domain-containing protein [Pseudoduganella lurida]TWI69074.1 hypothetical protein IP91_00139 [Pseudoduganella lurida]
MAAYASAVDESVFCVDELVERCGNDARAMAKVVGRVRNWMGRGSEPMELAAAAVADARFLEARHHLHRLRDDVSELGASRFVAACLGLELALAEGKVMQIPLLFSAAEAELRLVAEHAGAWLDQHAGRASAR